MVTLEPLTWTPAWVSHLGCLKGCLDFLQVPVTDAWLHGASGHAFVLNIHEELCPSGPTAWETKRMLELCENTGCRLEIIAAHKSQAAFHQTRQDAWQAIRSAIDNQTPCYGWELSIPEFYVIHGYDDTGYYFRGPLCESGGGPLPWQKLGDTDIGWIEVAIVRPADPRTDEQVVREALQFAVAYTLHPEPWTQNKYQGGLAGYTLWMESLSDHKADGFGTAYNAAVWATCRSHAARFLHEAKERLTKSLTPDLDRAATHYEAVAGHLKQVADTFPFLGVPDEMKQEHIEDPTRRTRAVETLLAAREEEEKGVALLQQIADKLVPEAAP